MILIGIDPGENTGLAVWDTTTRTFRAVVTLPLWKALDEVRRWHYSCLMSPLHIGFRVFFEDARQRRWFRKEASVSEYRGKLMGAGAAKRDARIWEEFLEANRIPFTAVPPSAGGTKWKEDYWKKVTGYTGRTSNHARDAALLVFGR